MWWSSIGIGEGQRCKFGQQLPNATAFLFLLQQDLAQCWSCYWGKSSLAIAVSGICSMLKMGLCCWCFDRSIQHGINCFCSYLKLLNGVAQLDRLMPARGNSTSFCCSLFSWCALFGEWWSSIGEGQRYKNGWQLYSYFSLFYICSMICHNVEAANWWNPTQLLLSLLDVEDKTLLLVLGPVSPCASASAVTTWSCSTVFFNWKRRCQLVQVLPSFNCQAA